VISAVIGFCLAALIGAAIVGITADSALPVVITPPLIAGLFVLTVVMCVGSAVAAIVKVMRVDPAMVFSR
jgi:putative ABC transport system permease protein